ncbi:helix-turn-helix transcriptional regulator [Litchfieldia alkalitelluris]|uniref:helix-turn-helix transcriptional regulator n=1 Tax=Litchfieldia alkalitelluris TaxID=304268 RepID=UPI000996EF57|nr:helix-turn-helix domain-containing protein [Litchfieldia alkalitelluris]
MEQTLKITNVLSDPTRYYIYQFVTKRHCEVTVQEIADEFKIHPNVARLHLSKLEDVNMLVSETRKTGKGGRPSRLYRLSDDIVQLHFPYRDYQLLAKVAIETMMTLGHVGKEALYQTGKRFGRELIQSEIPSNKPFLAELSFDEKLAILKQAATLAGFYPEVNHNFEKTKIFFHINNCPFKELAKEHTDSVCDMHYAFIQGMFEVLFDKVELLQAENMMVGCESCSYEAFVTK